MHRSDKFRNKEVEEALEKERLSIIECIQRSQFMRALELAKVATKKFVQKKCQYDRYYNITPYSNIVQEEYKLDSYVNASIVETGERLYLAAQMPKKRYFSNFVDFAMKSNADLVVSLFCFCGHSEKDYFDSYNLISRKAIPLAGNFSGQKAHHNFFYDELYDIGREIRRLKFCCWEDHCQPEDGKFRHFYDYFNKINPKSVIIHCYAGVGRTGTFIMYDILKKEKNITLEKFVDIFIYLRSKRPLMVFSSDQLEFLAQKFLFS